MHYFEFDPAAPLAAHIARYWGMAAPMRLPAGHAHQLPPDGCMAIIGTRSATGEVRSSLVGPRAEPLTLTLNPGDRRHEVTGAGMAREWLDHVGNVRVERGGEAVADEADEADADRGAAQPPARLGTGSGHTWLGEIGYGPARGGALVDAVLAAKAVVVGLRKSLVTQ